MDEWDAQKMLDLYIHDYLVRKNMHTTADILAQEADIQPKSVVINPPEGFLSEWWSLFWDVYSSRLTNNPQAQGQGQGQAQAQGQGQAQANQPTSSKAPANEGSSSQSALPDVSYMLQNMPPPSMARPGGSNMHQGVNPAPMPMPMLMPMPEMGSLLQNVFSATMPNPANRFGQTPAAISDHDLQQEQMMTDFIAQKVREQQNFSLPPRGFEAANANVVDQLANLMPLGGGSSSRQKKKVHGKRQLSTAATDVSYGAGFRRSITSELPPPPPRPMQDDIGHAADAGWNIFDNIPSEFLTVSNQRTKYPALPDDFQTDSFSDLAAQASRKLIIGASENPTKMITPTFTGEGSKGKGVQVERNTEIEKLLDEDIAAFFSNDEASDNMDISVTHTATQKESEKQDFPFGPVRSIHPSNNKLLCCDFSAQGKFLAAAGHEKKVFVWNMRQSSRQTLQGHTQLITDVRFKPNSNIFATSSFDKVVKIWDAANTKKVLFNLVGHAEQVNSVDFHPRKANLLCSCDVNDEIKLWNVKESTCYRSFKGATRQVRFQCRQGNLLAAATGNVINLIDVETGMIQHRFEGHEKEVRALCWDVCGDYLVSTSQDSTRIWSTTSGRCINELHSGGRDFASCTFHPAYSQVVAVGSYESIYIWNPAMGNKTWKFPAHRGIISAMANSPDSNMMASVSHDQWVKVWK